MKRIQFAVTYPERFRHPLQRRIGSDSPVRRAELLMWSPTEDATTLFWFDGDRAATEATIAGIDSLLVSRFVEDADGTYAFLQQGRYEFPEPVLAVIADARLIFLPPVVFRETGAVQFEAVGEAAALSRFHEALSDLGDLSIERVQPFERRPTASSLTDRQQAALEAAVAVGYYEIPREGSVENVAAALDCSASTAGELVRKTEAAVLAEYVGESPADAG